MAGVPGAGERRATARMLVERWPGESALSSRYGGTMGIRRLQECAARTAVPCSGTTLTHYHCHCPVEGAEGEGLAADQNEIRIERRPEAGGASAVLVIAEPGNARSPDTGKQGQLGRGRRQGGCVDHNEAGGFFHRLLGLSLTAAQHIWGRARGGP